jgi:GNAT superfamily N-acetyltransferase
VNSYSIHRYAPGELRTSKLEYFFNKNFSISDLVDYNVIHLQTYITKISEQAHHITICHNLTSNLNALLSYYINEKNCFITWFAVGVDFRGLGLGKRLMSELEITMKLQGISTIALEVLAANSLAIHFYEYHNFKLRVDHSNCKILKYYKHI